MKKMLFLFLVLLVAHAQPNAYEYYCTPCHATLPVEMDKLYMRYVLRYSSPTTIKKALIDYMQHPSPRNSVMTESFLRRVGIKQPTTLSDYELSQAIDVFIETYDVKKRLKSASNRLK